MNAWGVPLAAVPADALPACNHGHEVALMRRFEHGYALLCEQCWVVGAVIDADELVRLGWRLDDIEPA